MKLLAVATVAVAATAASGAAPGAPARRLSGLPDDQRLEHPGQHPAGGRGLGDDHRGDR